MGIRSAYLLLYNSFLSAAWGYVVYLMFAGIQAGKSRPKVYEDLKVPLRVAQSAAMLEVVHCATGVVRSPVMTTFIQVLSRIWCLWGIVSLVPEKAVRGSLPLLRLGSTQLELNLYTLLFAWGVTEVLRYAFFAVKLWLRYTTFLPLYPLGVSSELTMAYLVMPTIKARRLLSLDMPNKYNFGFDYYTLCWIVVLSYIPGFPFLYLYMLKQRRKLLGTPRAGKSKGA